MCCQKYWIRFFAFGLTFAIGIWSVILLFGLVTTNKQRRNSAEIVDVKVQNFNKVVYPCEGTLTGIGTGEGSGIGSGVSGVNTNIEDTKQKSVTSLKIISKPRANYTESARKRCIQGTVRLRVTFLANGQIGAISPVSGLPDGLTKQAIAAAKKIKFKAAQKNGKPVTVAKQVEYSFTIY